MPLTHCLAVGAVLTTLGNGSALAVGEPMVGCYPCDSLVRRYWQDPNSPWKERDSIQLLRDHGFTWLRFGITTQSCPELGATPDWESFPWKHDYWSCQEVGERVLAEAARAGMRLCLFFFLSDTAAHAGQQIPPADWKDLDVLQTCQALERYCFETVDHLKRRGLPIAVYEVGNEIERGICGFRPDERVPRPAAVDQLRDVPWMRQNVWLPEALLLTAAIRGIRRADPQGQIVLHIATRPSPEDPLVVGFFEAMLQAGVPFDYAGLSFYPWIGFPTAPPKENWHADLDTWVSALGQLGKPVIICEYSYPHHPVKPEPGMVAAPLPDYPFSPEGQAAWVRDFLEWCQSTPNVAGSFYFYPDYAWGPGEPAGRPEGLFLFDAGQLRPAPALLGFQRFTQTRRQ
jgi:arabinogalactan endo-1,4-beta-galactosidase